MEVMTEAALRVGRDPQTIKLVAASKMMSDHIVRQAHSAGIRVFGENRLQEAQQKQQALSDLSISWHFIGQVQRRKIKDVVGQFDVIHSVENLTQARVMNSRAQDLQIIQDILLQVNVSGEDSKGGYSVPDFMKALPELDTMSHLSVKGLMTIPPRSEDIESARPYFRQLRELASTVKAQTFQRISMDELSMGMSHDYSIAVEEGATMVRVGTALFGSRKVLQ